MRTKEEYEQMVLDTRPDLERAIEAVAQDAIATALSMIERHNQAVAERGDPAPGPVRNRHEAYGIAAEQLARIIGSTKKIQKDVDTLLGTLADPNYPAVEATSSIVNATADATAVLVRAAAEMKRTLDNLYKAEMTAESYQTPLEELASGDFQEAESLDSDIDPNNDDDMED